MLEATPFEVKNFSGGLNEDPTGDQNQYLQADNLFMTVEESWLSRPGSVLYDVSAAQLPSGNARVGTLINFNRDDTLLAQCGTHLYYYNAGTWTEIMGPTGNAAFIGASTAGRLFYSEWKKQLFFTSSEQKLPVKVYRDGSNNWHALTSGLPKPDGTQLNYVAATVLASAIAQANILRTAMLTHFAFTTNGFYPIHRVADTVAAAIIASGACTDLATLLVLVNQMLDAHKSHQYDAANVGVYHTQYQSNPFYAASLSDMTLTDSTHATDLISAVSRLNQLIWKFCDHEGSTVLHTMFAYEPTSDTYWGDILKIIATPTVGPNAIFDSSYIYSFANLIKTNYNLHCADGGSMTTAHSTAVDNVNNITAADATTPSTLTNLIEQIRMHYSDHQVDARKAAAWTYHVGQAGDYSLSKVCFFGDISAINSFGADIGHGTMAGDWGNVCTALNELKTVINSHMYNMVTHFTTKPVYSYSSGLAVGYPYLISGATLSLATYNYALTYSYTYTVGTTTFLTESEPYYFASERVLAIDIQPLVIRNIQTLANSTTTNYDTSSVKLNIYRTINAGTSYLLVDQVANGTSTYTDSITDAELLSSQTSFDQTANLYVRGKPLYTAGGVLPNVTPPSSKFIHIFNNFGYYANTATNPNRIQQSLAATPDGCPGGLFVDLPQEVQGLSSTRSNLIAWTATGSYRIEGNFDLQGNGSMVAVPISNVVGLSAASGIVRMDDGVIFPSSDGFYFTNGYTVQKLNKRWRQTYQALINTSTRQGNMVSAYNRADRRIWWGVTGSGTENDSCYVLDTNFPMAENSIFTSLSGGTSFAPTSLVSFAGQMIRGDSRGYIFKHDAQYKSDPKVNTATSASTWLKLWITYTLKTPSYDFGTSNVRKWVPSMSLRAENMGNLSLQIISNNDTGKVIGNLAPIRHRTASREIQEKRKFPAGSLRCNSKQLTFTNAKVVITNSDTLGQAALNHAAKTLTLLSGSWPADLSDQLITFVGDGYTTEWVIASQSGAAITITDAGGTLPADGVYKWEVKGYPKDETLSLVSFAVNVALLGPSQQSAQGETGANS